MALHVYSPTDWIPDDGSNGRTYPIPEREEDNTEIMYDKQVQNMSYITANMVAVFNEWITSFFEPDYFKFIRIKTQSTFTDFKSFMKDIYKKSKPFMVIDPRPPEIVEDSIFAQNMLNRYNLIDPAHDNIGAKMMYSLQIMGTELFELWFRRNRWRIEFDIMIMEESQNRRDNVYNRLIMEMRHNSKFTLIRNVPILLPNRHIFNIARFHRMNVESEQFLEFLNTHSLYPIIRRYQTNGRLMFYMKYDLHMYVEVPSFPAKDSAEMTDAIELGARLTDAFIFTADLPSEFMFLTKREMVGAFDRGVKENPNAITFISPIYADMPWPTEINGYTVTNHLDVEMQEGDEPKINILPFIQDFDDKVFNTIFKYIDHGGDISDLVMARVYPNGSMVNIGAVLHKDGTLEIMNPMFNKLYTICIYVNLKDVNLIRQGETTEYVGNLEKYD